MLHVLPRPIFQPPWGYDDSDGITFNSNAYSQTLWTLLIVLVGLLCCPLSRASTQSFPQEVSDLKPDPAAQFGILPNGLRYVIMPNHEPKGRVSLRFAVTAGSLNETEEQRGLAHFLEHLAFNGSTHFPLVALVEYFQRNGMSFGGDTNASPPPTARNTSANCTKPNPIE